ncbi:ABC transporter substrate-binding protein [Allochromatium warmingii]|uniref:ABC transporter substrate-binding protein n=1 Tax=Allochromatium warmingii TaxID=61595 RepID=UPI0015A5F43B|nr:transporter substrate-binding domain-containing protein [Allochromatium warmingii]
MIPTPTHAATATDSALEPVSLQLPWKHQFEFAGFYAALAQGFYRERGLAVELREYQPGLDQRTTVLTGAATFGLTNGQVIEWRLRGEPVILLANYFKKPPLVLLARSGLHRFADLRGRRLMADSDDLQSPLMKAALRDAGLIPGETLTIVPQTFDAGPLIRGDIDAMTAFITNDPFDLENKGIPFQVIEIGGAVPGLGDSYLFTAETLTHTHPKLIRDFIAASHAGWAYALAHVDELIELIHTQYAPQRSRAALRYEADRTRELMQPQLRPIGAVSPSCIEHVAQHLLEIGVPGQAQSLKGFLSTAAILTSATPTQPPTTTQSAETALSAADLHLSAAQRAWLAAHPVIRYTQWQDRAPIEYHDASGAPAGISQDYLTQVADALNLQLDYVPTASWTVALNKLRSGEIDLLPTAAITAERRNYLAFTQPYLNLPVAIFAPINAPFYGDLDALRGQPVAVIASAATEEWLRRDHPELKLVTVSDSAAGLRTLERRQTVAFVDSLLTASHLIGRDPSLRQRMAGNTPYRFALGMAVRRELAPLADILNQALNTISTEEREAIEQRWMQTPPRIQTDYTLLWQVSGFLIVIIASILYWNCRLTLTQAALQVSHARYDDLVRLIPVGLFTAYHHADGREAIEYLSPKAASLLAIEHTDPQSLADCDPLFVRVHPTDQADLWRHRHMAISQRQDCCWEGRMLINDETRWFRLEAIAEPQTDGSCRWQGVISDISAQKQAEAALIQARQAADTANRAKSDFLANMSHEIRTPMNAVLGMMYLCLNTELDAAQRHYLEQAQRAAKTLLALLNDILDFSKIESGYLQLEHAPFLLSGVLDNLRVVVSRKAVDSGLALHFDADPAIPDALCGDAMRLGQVLINLTDNAIKFTAHGQICVRVTCEQQDAEGVRLCFAVEDSGIGLSDEQMTGLFQPFQQADTSITRRYGGTGLGLSICKCLVDLLGGTISVSSRLGVGSTFRFSVRLAYAPADWALAPPAPFVSAEALVGQRVLIVEDSAVNRQLLRLMLERAGLVITEVTDGCEALQRLEQEGVGAWDVILMDIQMPELDGLAATRLIRARSDGASVPIIGLSARAQLEDSREALAAGMNAYLTKPIDLGQLFGQLQRWLAPAFTTPTLEAPPLMTPDSPASPEAIATARPHLATLLALARVGDVEAEEYFRIQRNTLAAALPSDTLTLLARHIDHYRFAEAVTVLEQWLQIWHDTDESSEPSNTLPL